MALLQSEKQNLLDVAVRAVVTAATKGEQLAIQAAKFAAALQEYRSCFVSLHQDGGLRGCIGSIEAPRPLIEDAAHNAYAAAIQDYRFEPLTAGELAGLELELTVLSPLEAIPCASEAELLAALRVGVDGLVIRDGRAQATFLPVMWKQLRTPAEFLAHLKDKAGMSPAHWSKKFQALRYRAEEELKTVIER